MSHGRKPRVCPICHGLVSDGGCWKGCSRCGWTTKPLPQEEQVRRSKVRALEAKYRSEWKPRPDLRRHAPEKRPKGFSPIAWMKKMMKMRGVK